MAVAWRRGRDSNPRWAFDPYSLSRGAPSAARPPLRKLRSITQGIAARKKYPADRISPSIGAVARGARIPHGRPRTSARRGDDRPAMRRARGGGTDFSKERRDRPRSGRPAAGPARPGAARRSPGGEPPLPGGALTPTRTWFPFTPSTVTVTSSPIISDSPTLLVRMSIASSSVTWERDPALRRQRPCDHAALVDRMRGGALPVPVPRDHSATHTPRLTPAGGGNRPATAAPARRLHLRRDRTLHAAPSLQARDTSRRRPPRS